MCVGDAGRERSGTLVPKFREETFFFSQIQTKFIVIRHLNESGREL